MTPTVVAGDPRQTLTEAAALMRSRRVGALVIVNDGDLTGIVTEHDLLRAMADGRDPAATHVSEYMTQEPFTIEGDLRADHAAAVMARHRIRHLPVTEKGRLVGLVSAGDLLALRRWPRHPQVAEPW